MTRTGRLSSYTRSMRVPMRQRSSQGMVPIAAAISRASMRSPSCSPRMTTSSPGDISTSTSVTSIINMSMHTAPTIGTRRPRTST